MSANFFLTFESTGFKIIIRNGSPGKCDTSALNKSVTFLDGLRVIRKKERKMAVKKGNLSINNENIFTIIKKWVYSDHDIFVRELISNGCDAITKLKKLDMIGEYSYPDDFENKIKVIVDPEKKTMKFIDTGIGMDADEVEEYITQIAFSGAADFIEKYKDKTR